MATSLVVNGTSYSFPDTGDTTWGDNVTNWASAITSGVLQRAGGAFTLTADTNFGANFGLVSLYYKSCSSNIAASGIVRLANTDLVSWRNAGNTADLPLGVDSSNNLKFNGISFLNSSGSILPTSLPTPTATTLGGIESFAAQTSKWINAISTSGVPSATQPSFSDISGTLSASQLPSDPISISVGGTGQTTQQAALNALAPQAPVAGQVISYNGTNWIASTIQAGAKNYITYNNFENNATTGWSLGNVTLTSNFPSGVPTFGSGADLHLEIGIVSSSQLAGSYSLSYDSAASGGAGLVAGNFLASQAYTIDAEDQAKVLAFKFYYKFISGTGQNFSGTSSNTYGVAIYDVTNSAWIMPAGVWNLMQVSGTGIAQGTFQTPSNMTQFRIVLFNANTTSAATTLYLDDFYVGPQALAFGPAVTDWQTVSAPVIGSTGTAPTKGTNGLDVMYWRRVGDSMEIAYEFHQTGAGSAGTGSYLLTIPNGLTIDTSKLSSTSFNSVCSGDLGILSAYDGTSTYFGVIRAYSQTQLLLTVQTSATGSGNIGAGLVDLSNATAHYSFRALIPITGWSSNTQMSADTDTRVVAMQATSTSTQSLTTATQTQITNFSASKDTHSALSANTYTVPISGFYRVTASLEFSTATSGIGMASIYKNGAALVNIRAPLNSTNIANASATTTSYCVAGDTFTVYGYQNSGGALALTGNIAGNYWNVERLSGPAVVAATESVNASYGIVATTSIGSSATTMVGDTKYFDSHNAYNTSTGVYTAPVTGKYRVSFSFISASASLSGGNRWEGVLNKNGSTYKNFPAAYVDATRTAPLTFSSSMLVQLNAGDQITVATDQNFGVTFTLSGSSTQNYIDIERVGN